MPKRKLPFHSILDEDKVLEVFKEHGIKPVHAMSIWKYVIKTGGAGSITDIPDLPHKVYELIPEYFGDKFLTSTVVEESTSADGTTTKLLIELQDGIRAESVIMRYDSALGKVAGKKDAATDARPGNKRATLCVSSQVGCQMGCTFCATGTMGLIGDLSAGEIVEQLVHASRLEAIRNVVFMGMGEPLNNYRAVRGAVSAMIDTKRFALSPAHVTVSTVGVIPKIRQLAEDLPQVNLALSLHAPTQELRTEIVPSGTAHKLDPLMAACDYHHAQSGRAVFVEYVMLAAVNDTEQCAHELGALLGPRRDRVIINLIPWNPMFAKDGAQPFGAPDPQAILDFQHTLRAHYDIAATIRQTMGQDINGACGQLALKKGVTKGQDTDIEDILAGQGKRGPGVGGTFPRRKGQSKRSEGWPEAPDGGDEAEPERSPATKSQSTCCEGRNDCEDRVASVALTGDGNATGGCGGQEKEETASSSSIDDARLGADGESGDADRESSAKSNGWWAWLTGAA